VTSATIVKFLLRASRYELDTRSCDAIDALQSSIS